MKYFIYLTGLALLLNACGTDKQQQLKELEKQRDEINTKIETLKSELAESAGDMQNINTWVKVKQVKPVEFKHLLTIQGTIESDNNILIPARASGVVKKIHVSEGQKVSKGQVLAELDGAIYERSIAELNTNLELATTIFERQQRLWKKNIGSEVQFLQAKTNKESLEKKLETVQEQYRLTKILAPISGTVDQVLIKEGEAAAAGFGTIRVVQDSKLKISAVVSEKYMGRIQVGDAVQIEFPSTGRSITSEITSVSQVIDSKNRTFPIEVKAPADIKELKPNMLVILKVNDYSNAVALTAPANIIQKTGQEEFLFTARPAAGDSIWQVSKQMIETSMIQDGVAEVTSGLSENDWIVVFGYQDLADGQKVKVTGQNGMVSSN